jgi:hypothetical protein
MSRSGIIERLGEPALRVGGFRLWVHGRQFPDANDEWDGNWLRVTAYCSASDASVYASGPYLDTVSIYGFRKGISSLVDGLQGAAVLQSVEPNIRMEIKSLDALGHFQTRVDITPDHMAQDHVFRFEIDQTFFGPILSQCASILKAYPIKNPAGRSIRSEG